MKHHKKYMIVSDPLECSKWKMPPPIIYTQETHGGSVIFVTRKDMRGRWAIKSFFGGCSLGDSKGTLMRPLFIFDEADAVLWVAGET